jgi:Nitroreductase family
MQRRKFIKIVGGGIVIAAGAAVISTHGMFEVPASAVAAWKRPSNDLELRHWVLSYALLAPNPHNMQPWLADLGTSGKIILSLDPDRLLPATDPYGRQILMGAGAFLELLTMAAAERGYRAECELFPEGLPDEKLDGKAFAKIHLIADANVVRDPLFKQVLNRRTDRRVYDLAQSIVSENRDRLRAAIGNLPVRFGLLGNEDELRIAAIRNIVREAWRIELTTEATMMESMRVLRIGSGEIDEHRDGISITKPLLVLLTKFGLFDREKFPSADSQATTNQIHDFDALTASTPAYLWLVTEGNHRSQQIDAGRAYVRVNLCATEMGLAMHPNQQSLQEYPEAAIPYAEIHQLLNAPAPRYTVQMLARVGHLAVNSTEAPPAPRRGLVTHIINKAGQ